MNLPPRPRTSRGWALTLWALLTLFVLRVAGQILVAIGLGNFLPSWEERFSGAVPYVWLLASQILIVALLARVCLDLSRAHGCSPFVVRLSDKSCQPSVASMHWQWWSVMLRG